MIASTMTCLLAMMAPATVPSDTPTPNLEALALAPTVGWLMLLAFALVVAIFTVHRETWRRLFLRAEDPRSVAAFRIAFGLMTMANINGLWELFHYLFTDEGLFFADVAQEVFAKDQFEGFGDGVGGGPRGFFDWAAVVEFIKGPKFSLLFFWDSPTAFWLHLAGFWLACTCLIVGYKTKYAKWATFILFNSIILRNQVFWEGTENVYRCFLFYLCLSRCGAAYSVDNWLRCRRLRAQGLLSERDGPGGGAGVAPSPEHPRGLEAVYKLIPAWPRMLMILQVAALYCSTGAVKNGAVWKNGDAFYYALNLDHFYRFEPQQLSAIFGTNLFRINTWVVHWWEACFPLVVLGLVSRFMRREQVPPPPRAALWLGRVCWVLLGLTACAIVYVVLPVHIPRATPGALRAWQQWFPVAWIGGMAMIAGVIMWLRRRPPCVTIRGVRHVLDLDWFCTWFLGRRLWLGLGVIFHAHLIMMMNIGWFTPATLSTYFVFLNGSELAHLLQPLGARLARLGVPMPAAVRRGEPPCPPRTRPSRSCTATPRPCRAGRCMARSGSRWSASTWPCRARPSTSPGRASPVRASTGVPRARRSSSASASSATSRRATAAERSCPASTRRRDVRGAPGRTPRWADSSPARCASITSPAWRSGCSRTRTRSAARARTRGACALRTRSSGGSG